MREAVLHIFIALKCLFNKAEHYAELTEARHSIRYDSQLSKFKCLSQIKRPIIQLQRIVGKAES